MNRPMTSAPNANRSGDFVGWYGFPVSDVLVGNAPPEMGVAFPYWPGAEFAAIYEFGNTGGT